MSTTQSSGVANDANAQAVFAALNKRADSKSSAMSGTQDQFLKLLTTQLRNQDPLNPMDNAQMTSQLAQISTVDGIQQLNTTLQTMLSNTNDAQAMQAAALVGHGVLVPGSNIDMANGSGYAGVDLAGPADKVTVTIKNANGLVVRTLQLGSQSAAGVKTFAWDGKNDAGTAVANGSYKFSVEAVQGSGNVSATALGIGLVDSVMRNGKGINLNVGSLGSFSLNDVREVM